MDSIPALIAGCKEIIMVTPPDPDGTINPAIVGAAVAAQEISAAPGKVRIFKTGGAQAIAALAYGTESIPKVDKIVGPGNAYVAEAKRQVFGKVAIDMIAGPSEILAVADGKSDAAVVAADMLSQAEHDRNASAVLVTDSRELAEKVQQELEQLKLDNAELEKQLDQNIELMKRLEIEKKVEQTIQKMEKLAEEQRDVSRETEQARSKDKEQLMQKQQAVDEKFKQLKQDIDQIKQDYKELDPSLDFEVPQQLQQQVEKEQQQQSDLVKKLEESRTGYQGSLRQLNLDIENLHQAEGRDNDKKHRLELNVSRVENDL
jgi:hypothetical protein